MPQLQNLVLTDRAATPVNHTFVPRSIDKNGVVTVVESSGIPIGDKRVTIGSTRTASGKFKYTLKYTFPVVATETINGVSRPTVLRASYIEVICTFDPTSTEQERKDAVGQVESSLGASKTLINDSLIKMEGIY